MNMTSWSALFLVSWSWSYAHGYIVAERPAAQVGLILAAWVLLAWDARRERTDVAPTFAPMEDVLRTVVWALPLAFVGMFAERGGSAPAFLCAGAFLFAGCAKRVRWLDPVGRSGLVLAAILLAQAPLFHLYAGFTARNPDVPGLAVPIARLLEAFGAVAAATTADDLVVHAMKYTYRFPLTWTCFGAFPLLALWVAGSVVVVLRKPPNGVLRALGALTATLCGFAVVRVAVVITCFLSAMLPVGFDSEAIHTQWFWHPTYVGASIAFALPFLVRFVRVGGSSRAASGDSGRPAGANLARVCAALGVAGFVLWNAFPDPGTKKRTRMLVDEAHSRWERSDRPFDENWYGSESTYNYFCMIDWLRHHGTVDWNLDGELDDARLANVDVLILKTPTAQYSDAEIDAIERFVSRGGGALLMGDHTNVFGHGVYLNAVARRFGMSFRFDCVFDVERRFEQLELAPRVPIHPVAADVESFQFAVASSIDASSWTTRPILRGRDQWTLPIDYSVNNFYPWVMDHTYARVGCFDHCVAQTHGAGRVIAFSDSTVYSNFEAFKPGRAELLLGAVGWLDRSNRFDWISWIGLIAGFVLTSFAAWWCVRSGPSPLAIASVLASGTLAATLTTLACGAAMRAWYPPPSPHTPPTTIGFDLKHGSGNLPIFGFTTTFEHSFDVFFQWMQRLGYFPRATWTAAQLLESNAWLVLLPNAEFDAETARRLEDYVRKGGVLIVLDRAQRPGSTANAMLKPFGIELTNDAPRGQRCVEPSTRTTAFELGLSDSTAKRDASLVTDVTIPSGGEPLLTTDLDEPLLVWKRHGRGAVIAGTIAQAFTDGAMGSYHQVVPDVAQRKRYELQFVLMRGVIDGDVVQRLRRFGLQYARDS